MEDYDNRITPNFDQSMLKPIKLTWSKYVEAYYVDLIKVCWSLLSWLDQSMLKSIKLTWSKYVEAY